MRAFRIWFWTWFNAWRDKRANLPTPGATTLGSTESEIRATMNSTIALAWGRFRDQAATLEGRRSYLHTLITDQLEPEYARLCALAGRTDVRVSVSPWQHVMLLVAVFAAETFWNTSAFLFQHLSYAFTLTLAALVSLCFAVPADLIGAKTRQWHALPAHSKRQALILCVALAVLVVAGIYGLNTIRRTYNTTVLMVPDSDAFFFACIVINLLGVGAAFAVAWRATDPQPGFVSARSAWVSATYELSEVEKQLDGLNGAFESEQHALVHSAHDWLHFYRRCNRRHRAGVPCYFEDERQPNYLPTFDVFDTRPLHAPSEDKSAVDQSATPRLVPSSTSSESHHVA